MGIRYVYINYRRYKKFNAQKTPSSGHCGANRHFKTATSINVAAYKFNGLVVISAVDALPLFDASNVISLSILTLNTNIDIIN